MIQPNIILITTDQQRYDTLGCNGNSIARTPALDGIAAEGTRFDSGFINNPVCIPSRACIQTGRYTHQHTVRYMESKIDDTPGLPAHETTFMEHLQSAGYYTGAVGKVHMKPPKGLDFMRLTDGKGARWKHSWGSPFGPAQLGEEYARWLEQRHPGGYEAIYEQRRHPEYDEYQTAIINTLPGEEHLDYWTTENALEFVQQKRDKPYFLWFGMCNPHAPVDPSKDYAALFPEEKIVLSKRQKEFLNKPGAPSEKVVRRFTAYYHALCAFVDDMVARLRQTLEQSGQWDNTLIIFTSDHGEMMGDFGRFGKGNFDDAVVRVPMIIKPPKGTIAKHDTNELVELIDIAPTILDYAGARGNENIAGKSMRPIIEGKGAGKDAILCEYLNNDKTRQGVCLRTKRYKYAYWQPDKTVELYDMQEDPGEWHNLADNKKYQQVRIDMHEQLLSKLACGNLAIQE